MGNKLETSQKWPRHLAKNLATDLREVETIEVSLQICKPQTYYHSKLEREINIQVKSSKNSIVCIFKFQKEPLEWEKNIPTKVVHHQVDEEEDWDNDPPVEGDTY